MWSLWSGSSSKGGYSSYVSRDLEDYRAHYPDNTDDVRKDKNLLFFRNEYPMQPEGVLIEEALTKWRGRYGHLESSHSFIQWLFPIQEKGMNYQSQVLQRHEIASMRADPIILQRVVRVFKLMLDFYGMKLVDEQKGLFERLPDGEYEPQYRNLNSSSHNYLRITRILKNLGEMGFEHLKVGWLEFLFVEICIERRLSNCKTSFYNYWSGTIYDDAQRDAFLKRCKAMEADMAAGRKRQRELRGGGVAEDTAATASSAAGRAKSVDIDDASSDDSYTKKGYKGAVVHWDEDDGSDDDEVPIGAMSGRKKAPSPDSRGASSVPQDDGNDKKDSPKDADL